MVGLLFCHLFSSAYEVKVLYFQEEAKTSCFLIFSSECFVLQEPTKSQLFEMKPTDFALLPFMGCSGPGSRDNSATECKIIGTQILKMTAWNKGKKKANNPESRYSSCRLLYCSQISIQDVYRKFLLMQGKILSSFRNLNSVLSENNLGGNGKFADLCSPTKSFLKKIKETSMAIQERRNE